MPTFIAALLRVGVFNALWVIVVVAEALPAAAGVCRLSGPVSDAAHQQAKGVEVGAAQGHHRAPLR